jgi:hypothetical protein
MSASYKKTKAENEYELKTNGQSKLISISRERTSEGKKDYSTCWLFAINPKYAFGLTRITPLSRWTVVELSGNNPQGESEFRKAFEEIDKAFNVLVRLLDNFLISEMVASPDFRLLRARWIQRGGEKLVEVAFQYPHKVADKGNPIQAGTLVLDPNRFWILRSYEVEQKYPGGRGTGNFQLVEFDDSKESVPIPKHVVFKYDATLDVGIRNIRELRYDYELAIPGRLPGDDEFTLSHFGLPEPPKLARKTSWYLWASLLGLCSLALAGLFHWRARKPKARPARV